MDLRQILVLVFIKKYNRGMKYMIEDIKGGQRLQNLVSFFAWLYESSLANIVESKENRDTLMNVNRVFVKENMKLKLQ